MFATNLKTEFLTDPVGIDIERPRLFWNCEGGKKQAGYQIVARKEDGTILWDSGKVESRSMRAAWGGEPVPARTKVIWRIRLWEENSGEGSIHEGNSGKVNSSEEALGESWAEAFFETGIGHWEAKWITGNYIVNPAKCYPVDCFGKNFVTGELSEIEKARLYITACGLYEATLNGKRVGEEDGVLKAVLVPGITEYRKRIQYQTFDVTSLLREGKNALSIRLSDGWYRGSTGAWGIRNQYGTETKVLAQLEITLKDKSTQYIVTDKSWRWSNDGAIVLADIQDGEVVDARLKPSYKGRAKETSHKVTPVSSNNVPVTEHERLTPTVITTPSGKKVLDFGQNIAGYVEFRLKAQDGQQVFMRFGELLDEEGEFTQKNIQLVSKFKTTPLQQVSYTCKEGMNHYKTTFSIFGFQYILLETDVEWKPEDFIAIAVYSDLERTGWFESSNPLLDQFVENTVWSAKNNHADLPTDCPTRERHGWTGDAQIFCSTASFLFDYAAFARKYQKDLTDAQHKDGCFPQIVPVGGNDFYMKPMDGSAGWSDAGVFIPYEIFLRYGDRAILGDNYEAMRSYTRYKIGTLGKWYMTARSTGVKGEEARWISNYGQSYGEWAEPVDVCAFAVSDFVNPHPEETTAYIALLLDRMTKIAEILGYEEDASEFSELAVKVRKGYQALVRTEGFSLDTDRQAKLVRPLYMHLLDKEQTDYAKDRLLKALDHYKWCLGTGFLSTPMILYVLSELGTDYAYRLLENEEIPGWLSMPKNGATTIWESWEGPAAQGGVASLNHYSKGALVQWLFDTMCGISVDPLKENHFIIKPLPGGHFTHAKATYQSIYGRIESGWKMSDSLTFEVNVPANCTALISLPDGSEHLVEAGVWKFTIDQDSKDSMNPEREGEEKDMSNYEKEHLALVMEHAAECTVLLKTDGKFPLEKPGKLAAFGAGLRYTVKGGTGSGEVNSRETFTIEEGLEKAGFEITTKSWLDAYDEERAKAKKQFIKAIKKEAIAKRQNPFIYCMGKVMLEPEHELVCEGEGEAAIYVVSRISGEGSDRLPVEGDVKLARSEIRDILALNEKFERFMLVLNVGGVVDLTPVKDVSNILVLSQLGVDCGQVLADILTGKQNPSGKLATTWASWEDYSHEGTMGEWDDNLYKEGIYVGYRYFDTFGKKPLFPFGFGLSYTDFSMETTSVTCKGDVVHVSALVKNTGERAGKEVAQVYVSLPDGRLDKAYQELAAFAKTSLLAPGKSEELTLSFKLSDFASYDEENACYLLEAGDYMVRVGNSSVDTEVTAVLTLDETVVTMKARNCLGKPEFEDLKKAKTGEKNKTMAASSESVEAVDGQIQGACMSGGNIIRLFIAPSEIPAVEVAYDLEYEIDERVRALTDEELGYLAIGAFDPDGGALSVIGNASTSVAGAAGETTSQLKKNGVKPLVMADGPAGLRLALNYYEDEKGAHKVGGGGMIPESVLEFAGPVLGALMRMFSKEKNPPKGAKIKEQACTMIPIGTAIAQSFNVEMAKAFGDMVGSEMEMFGVRFWLAPALNIHRSILCGRNFEYYSEDPLVSGLMAAAITEGVQSHKDCATTIKHYAANNAENNRYNNNSQVSERAMREIYLRGFGICVRKAQPHAVMTSYNLLNGTHTSEHRGLIEDILRCEYGFKGVVMTDWVLEVMSSKNCKYRGALSDEVCKAGGDLFMPGGKDDYKRLMRALSEGRISRRQLEINGTRIVRIASEEKC